ncbi:unnamed protein product [Chrysoparadoxa australica]
MIDVAFEACLENIAGKDPGLAREEGGEEGHAEDKGEEGVPAQDLLLMLSEGLKVRAREMFDAGEHRQAFRTYMKAASQLAGGEAGGRQQEMCISCACNAAIAAFKDGSYSSCVEAVNMALAKQGDCIKALYWRARAKVGQRLYDAALKDLTAACAAAQSQGEDGRAAEALKKRIELRQVQLEERQVAVKAYGKVAEKERQDEIEKLEQEYNNWAFPKPPSLNNPDKTASQLLHEFSLQSKFDIDADYEEHPLPERLVTPIQHSFKACTMKIMNRVWLTAWGSSAKKAKQNASAAVLKEVIRQWNFSHPEDPLPPEASILPERRGKKDNNKDDGTVDEAFLTYAKEWAGLLVRDEVQRAVFSSSFSQAQRKAVHAVVGGLHDSEVFSKSSRKPGKPKRVAITRRSIMCGAMILDGGSVVEISVPGEMSAMKFKLKLRGLKVNA